MKTSKTTKNKPEEMYYIQSGYIGNAILWWGKDSSGYTAHFEKAGKYSKDEALKILANGRDEYAWLCSHVDDCKEAQVLTIETRYLNMGFRLTGKKL